MGNDPFAPYKAAVESQNARFDYVPVPCIKEALCD
jgi:hypothetical protein